MTMFWKRNPTLVVVVATRHPEVLAALATAAQHLKQVHLERREALSVAGAYRALAGAHLALVDPDALTGEDEVTRQALQAALASPRLITAAGAAFVAAPVALLEAAVAAAGLGTLLPPRSVAFTAWAGGVGQTTLALATTRAFHAATGLPAAVIELVPGPSALRAALNVEGADVYQVVSQAAAYPTWEGVTLGLMDWGTAQLLTPEQLTAHWQQIAREHVFVAYDAPAWHPRLDQIQVAQVYVLADHRADAQVAAVALAEQLRAAGYAPEAVRLGLNQAGLAARLALPEKPAFALQTTRRPVATLGGAVLQAIYPGWRG